MRKCSNLSDENLFTCIHENGIVVRILALTDIHYNLSNLRKIIEKNREVDLILVAGDLTNFGGNREAKDVLSILESSSRPFFFVPGNVDIVKEFSSEVNARNVHGKHVLFENIAILGLGGSTPTPFNTPFELSEEQIAKILDEAYKGLKVSYKYLVLISHVPPYNTLLDLTKTRVHVGSRSVRSFLESHNIDLLISGHVHEARNIDRFRNSLLINPGPVNLGYYAIIDLNSKIEAKLESLK